MIFFLFFRLFFFKSEICLCLWWWYSTSKALSADREVQQINDERDFQRTAVMALWTIFTALFSMIAGRSSSSKTTFRHSFTKPVWFVYISLSVCYGVVMKRWIYCLVCTIFTLKLYCQMYTKVMQWMFAFNAFFHWFPKLYPLVLA